MKRCGFIWPWETPDSKGITRARVRAFGRCANAKDITIIVLGIARAMNP